MPARETVPLLEASLELLVELMPAWASRMLAKEELLLDELLPLCSLSRTERRSLVRAALPLTSAVAELLDEAELVEAVLSEVELVDAVELLCAAETCAWMACCCCWAKVLLLVTVSDTIILPLGGG